MALYCSPDYQTSLKSVGLSVQEKKFNIDFQDEGHLLFAIRMILTTFDLRHPETSNKVSSRLAFCFRIKKVQTDFQHCC